ncbi:hypothetical protein K491DRAFT_692896 [Lophiostoma macrostomum CBS 122681]|uniref:Uncharacterized protein n=1 Tax=Lophiostoma macrostomum CBS 122681 TaxID=1314788 RepID=A0A6A6T875_9PLEO|nr:hypothetical protein K491DRAFT_692896 [Lophiostoma macrostomum CBS 122681]
MSSEYTKDPLTIAKEAERDLNSEAAKKGHDANVSARHGKGASDSTLESGVDESVRNKFPGADVTYGSAASGAGDNREIPLSEGGDLDPRTGKPYKAKDFEGLGGPEDKDRKYAEEQGGNDDVRGNVRN